jgi:hypothetical protein
MEGPQFKADVAELRKIFEENTTIHHYSDEDELEGELREFLIRFDLESRRFERENHAKP